MKRYIALLRGINVGGKNIIKMNELKSIFEQLSFYNVSTYIQSGNIIFSSEIKDKNKLEVKIYEAISQTFNLKIPVWVLTVKQLKEIISENPFQQIDNDSAVQISIFKTTVEKSFSIHLEAIKGTEEEFFVSENAFYLYCPQGYHKTKYTNTFLEKQFQSKTTNRNLKTLKKVQEFV